MRYGLAERRGWMFMHGRGWRSSRVARKEGPKAKLGWRMPDNGEFVFEPHAGPNRIAAEAVLAAVEEHLSEADEAMATGFVMLAEAVDSDPTNAALWGQYRAAELAVRGVATRGDDDEFSRLMAELSAEVRDSSVREP